jgi:hypothetical protein
MKGLLEEKQRELNNLKEQLQNALSVAKSLCPLFKSVIDVSVVTIDSMISNRLQGGIVFIDF